jgi:putative spermidine/putrescine transport system ATP-binding protein
VTAYLELEKLHKEFGEFTAIDELDVALEAGEFLSLLGPSGCGKTTALRIVAGFETPTSGRVVVEGNDVTNVPANKRDMGMVFQAYSLFPNMSAEDNVEFGLRVRRQGAGDRRRRVEELLELVGLTAAAKRYPHQLSGGMQQRVALARALAIEPRVLLLDEPLSALDAKVRVQLREEIRRLQTQLGITTLYVTHDQEEALSISDRVAVLSHGRIEQIGAPADIYNEPSTPFVAEFIGTMNRLEATVADEASVQVGGTILPVAEARGLPRGEKVLVLVRPETLQLERVDGGGEAPGALVGEVLAHIFLGPITRVKVIAGDHELSADLPGPRAADLPIGSRVAARFPADAGRVLALSEQPEAPAEPAPAGQ